MLLQVCGTLLTVVACGHGGQTTNAMPYSLQVQVVVVAKPLYGMHVAMAPPHYSYEHKLIGS